MRSQLHAGQLRYHDFTKWRELHQSRQRGIVVSSPFGASAMTSVRFLSSSSPFSLSNAKWMLFGISPSGDDSNNNKMEQVELKRLEGVANLQLANPGAQYEFVARLLTRYPELVVQRYVQTKAYPVDSKLAYLYLAAMQQTQNYNHFRMEELIQRMEIVDPLASQMLQQEFMTNSTAANNSGGSGTANNSTTAPTAALGNKGLPKRDQVQRALQALAKVLATTLPAGTSLTSLMAGHRGATSALALGAGGGGGGFASLDPSKPLQVRILSSGSIGSTAATWAIRIVLGFIVISALATLADEKGVGKALGVTQSGKHIQEAENSNVRFEDVKGVGEAKAELEEIVEFLKDQTKFTRLGGKLPRGLLLIGPPGTGKTLLAKAVAGEAGVPFFFSSGSQFEEVYVGLGARRVRELFEAAKKKAPCIVFIDEIDALGGTRKLKDQSALKMTLNELLVQLDGFEDNTGIIVIGATNFADSLDQALLRPGRFDKHVTVPLPDIGGRKEILEMYAQKTKLSDDVDLEVLARGTTGMSGADLHNLMNQAAVKASVDGLNFVTMAVLEYAKDKILMGAERKSAVISDETKKCTAFHEAGHALVATLTRGAQPIHKATIMPRGQSLGMVTQLPDGDQTSQSYKEMLAYMDVCMGGRVAEELIFGEENVTSGASSDIRQATRLARAMVTRYGFSDTVGIVYHDLDENGTASDTRASIDKEVKRLTDASYQRVKQLLAHHSAEHKLLAECLLEFETLTGEEVRNIVLHKRKPTPRADKSPTSPTPSPTTKVAAALKKAIFKN